MVIPLTDRQALASVSNHRFTNIVSAPGSGKTTIATERFGFVANARTSDRRGVVGLSFTRAAVGELNSRVSARWGHQALGVPNLVTTFDDFHVRVMHHLLGLGLIRWPGGPATIRVLDEYRGMKGFRFREAGSFKRIAACRSQGGLVVSGVHRVKRNESGFGGKADHEAALDEGNCSHEDVRWILRSAIRGVAGTEDAIKAWIQRNFRHMIIDEIYDADGLDLWTAAAAGESGTDVTVVGDPWQALYGWRGATPDKVQNLLESLPFVAFDQPESFRFRSPQMRELAKNLRASRPAIIPSGSSSEVDVALARKWADLWDVGDNVLPLGFRTIENATDAMLNLLLDEVTRHKIGRETVAKATACVYLRIDPTAVSSVQSRVFGPVLAALRGGSDARSILSQLRETARQLGANRRPSKLGHAKELKREAEVDWIRVRLQRDDLIPGLTVHQAKGRQWSRVGVALSQTDRLALTRGLQPLDEDDCVLYVALTRARDSCVSLP